MNRKIVFGLLIVLLVLPILAHAAETGVTGKTLVKGLSGDLGEKWNLYGKHPVFWLNLATVAILFLLMTWIVRLTDLMKNPLYWFVGLILTITVATHTGLKWIFLSDTLGWILFDTSKWTLTVRPIVNIVLIGIFAAIVYFILPMDDTDKTKPEKRIVAILILLIITIAGAWLTYHDEAEKPEYNPETGDLYFVWETPMFQIVKNMAVGDLSQTRGYGWYLQKFPDGTEFAGVGVIMPLAKVPTEHVLSINKYLGYPGKDFMTTSPLLVLFILVFSIGLIMDAATPGSKEVTKKGKGYGTVIRWVVAIFLTTGITNFGMFVFLIYWALFASLWTAWTDMRGGFAALSKEQLSSMFEAKWNFKFFYAAVIIYSVLDTVAAYAQPLLTSLVGEYVFITDFLTPPMWKHAGTRILFGVLLGGAFQWYYKHQEHLYKTDKDKLAKPILWERIKKQASSWLDALLSIIAKGILPISIYFLVTWNPYGLFGSMALAAWAKMKGATLSDDTKKLASKFTAIQKRLDEVEKDSPEYGNLRQELTEVNEKLEAMMDKDMEKRSRLWKYIEGKMRKKE